MLRTLAVVVAMLAVGRGASMAQCAGPAAGGAEILNRNRNNDLTHGRAPAGRPSSTEDFGAENELLKLANQSRELAGALPLRMEESLRDAALQHARQMIANDRLEHQYSGEPALLQRIAKGSSLRMDRAGENLALASCAPGAHEVLMHSPPHRQNLIDSGFNVAGFAAIWSKGKLYVVQDFAHEVRSYSPHESDKLVGQSIVAIRQQAGLSELTQMSPSKLDEAACSLSSERRPNARLLATAYDNRKIVTYTQGRPEVLPAASLPMLRDPMVSHFAVGACYARNAAYPTGIYWVAILLY